MLHMYEVPHSLWCQRRIQKFERILRAAGVSGIVVAIPGDWAGERGDYWMKGFLVALENEDDYNFIKLQGLFNKYKDVQIIWAKDEDDN